MTFSRRMFLTTAASGFVAVGNTLCPFQSRVVEAAEENVDLVKPLPQQLAWQDSEIGIVYHFDMPVYAPGGWRAKPANRTVLDPNTYNPVRLDTDQWLDSAKAAGAKFAIFTATHEGGFLQWQSDLYPYGVKQTKWRDGKGDVFLDFVESCHRYGIRPGVYLSVRFNAYWEVINTKINHGVGGDEEKQERYLHTAEKMVEELCSRYGELFEIWFDGGVLMPEQGGPDVLPIVDRHQPNIVFYHSRARAHHRWVGNESGVAGYPCWATMPNVESHNHLSPEAIRELLPHGDPDGNAWMPPMCDVPIRNHRWFWEPDEDRLVYPLDELMNMYDKSVGRNGVLLFGATPDRDGLIPTADAQRYAEFGREVQKRFGKPLAETSGKGTAVVLELPKPLTIDCVSVMESIAEGERIREYVIEGLVGADQWRLLADGTSVGHKRLQTFNPVEIAKLRLRVVQSVATPLIRNLAVFRTNV